MVDFSKKIGKKRQANSVEPLALYETLDWESDKGPLRPAQVSILTEWHAKRRNEGNVIIKLHTGQGKTLIGLLCLLSKLNERKGPALYLCPNEFLASQTCKQAKQFGVPYCTDDGDLPAEFLDGHRILITHIQKLFNGHTRFGLGNKSLPIGSIVMDDAHACIDAIRDAMIIKIPRENASYASIIDLFQNALTHQGAGTLADIREGSYEAILPVPYWAWQDRQNEIIEILAKHCKAPLKPTDSKPPGYFAWPIVKDALDHCQCFVSGQSIEISPYLPPIDRFGSYAKAPHRIFMSATVTNDAFLVHGLRLAPATVRSPLTVKDEKWSGEKMVLVPSLIDEKLDRMAIVNEFGKSVTGRRYGAVALTPSFKAAENWKTCGARVATSKTIDDDIARLRNGNCDDTLAIASRYDGIDLPDATCRILILDSLPYSQSLRDAYEDTCRSGSNIVWMRQVRSIEQGLGRSVRGEKDYCVIIIVGPELVKAIRSEATRSLLSGQTRAQIEIGLEVAQLARNESKDDAPGMSAVHGLVKQCLRRDSSWKQYYSEKMDEVASTAAGVDGLDIFQCELEAETAFQHGDGEKAVTIMQQLIDERKVDDQDKGWYLQRAARYKFALSKVESNKLQIAAHKQNRYVLRPQSGMVVDKIDILSNKRIENIIEWVTLFGDYEELRLAVDDLLSSLEFGVKADRFEEGVHRLGRCLGFVSQRPEKEWKAGPDNLWAVRNGEYFVIECKSEVSLDRVEIHKSETGQMNNACAWFKENYKGAKCVRGMIIPTKKVAKAAGFNESVGILRRRGLDRLTRNVRLFCAEFAAMDFSSLSEKKIQQRLTAHELDVDKIYGLLEEPSR